MAMTTTATATKTTTTTTTTTTTHNCHIRTVHLDIIKVLFIHQLMH